MRKVSAVLVLGLLVLGGCGGGEPDDREPYVALGDSSVSGPSIGQPDVTSPGCLRSEGNYPHLVAEELPDLALEDVSCGGETTQMLLDGRTLDDGTELDPQIEAVTPRTRLVTVGIGANDGNAAGAVFSYCFLPDTADDGTCSDVVQDYLPKVYPATAAQVDKVLTRIRERAPRATVVLTGLLRYAPETGTCDDLPVSDVRREAALAWEERLNEVFRDVAKDAGVPFVDMRALAEGHDACSDDPWVNGVVGTKDDGSFLHPTAAGMRAVAEQVLEVVREG